jgi:hypothetical protein
MFLKLCIIPLSIKTINRIIEKCAPLYEQGFSLRDVEEQTGIPKSKIRGTFHESGIPLRNFKNGKNLIKNGIEVKCGGHPPFGWLYLDGKLVIDPKEHIIVRKILKLHQSGKSNQDIANTLNTSKFPTHKGNPWVRGVIRTIIIREKKI